jgi:hypothetical protein
MKVKLFRSILSHFIVAVCYDQLMRSLSSCDTGQASKESLDRLSFAPPKSDLPASSLSRRGEDKRQQSEEASFSACLLVMDENFRLQEWLAFAYLTLPLRYLVVSVDPNSKFSPTEKLNIFRSELNMTIIEWKGKN